MEVQYTVRAADGREYGPATLEELKEWIAQGRVPRQQQVRRSDMDYWAAAGEFQEFQDAYSANTGGGGAAVGTTTTPRVITQTAGPQAASSAQVKSAGAWFYWVAALSLVNSVAALSGINWRFIIGLGVTQIFDAVGAEIQAGGKMIVFLLDLLAAGVLVAFGFFAQKGHTWAFIVGMMLLGLDGIIFVMAKDWLGVAFHVFVLYCLFRGVAACRARAPQALPR